jgi:hypothetical protein
MGVIVWAPQRPSAATVNASAISTTCAEAMTAPISGLA